MTPAFRQLIRFSNLLEAYKAAARGKTSTPSVLRFNHRLSDNLISLQRELASGQYQPGHYTHFSIHEPKHRIISAAPFRDRIVHHALCNIIEPEFERVFIADSYANRRRKGTHLAITRLQQWTRQYRFALRMDIVKHFQSIDHAILLDILGSKIPQPDIMNLIRQIVMSGAEVPTVSEPSRLFPGDDLLSALRSKGLPIGNLTSQFWSNCYLHGLDVFVKRELSCPAYLRYVDDFVLLGNCKKKLYQNKHAIIDRFERLRLITHDAQVTPVDTGIPWLGFIVYPEKRRVKSRKVRNSTRRLRHHYHAWERGELSYAQLDACFRGWWNHIYHADSAAFSREMLNRIRL